MKNNKDSQKGQVTPKKYLKIKKSEFNKLRNTEQLDQTRPNCGGTKHFFSPLKQTLGVALIYNFVRKCLESVSFWLKKS
jgi:hypothetical protein